MRQQLTQPRERLNSYRPAKQRRALLESNPPRDSWIERRRNKNVSTFGEAKTSPNAKRQTFISEPEHALKNSSKTISTNFRDGHQQQKPLRKNYVSWYPFFRSKPSASDLSNAVIRTVAHKDAITCQANSPQNFIVKAVTIAVRAIMHALFFFIWSSDCLLTATWKKAVERSM